MASKRAALWEPALLLLGALCALALVFPTVQSNFAPLQAAYYVLAGWVYFLRRTLPEVAPEAGVVLTAGACLAGLGVGLHLFLRWLRAHAGWRPGATAALLGGVVLLFAAGLAVVGMWRQVSWLVRSEEPLVKRKGGVLNRQVPDPIAPELLNLPHSRKGAP
jgi:hypothetical protein